MGAGHRHVDADARVSPVISKMITAAAILIRKRR
jgi:hypothetical protein